MKMSKSGLGTRIRGVRCRTSPVAMEHQADEEDDEEVVDVPEHLEVRPADHLHGRGDDEDESQRDHHPRQPGYGGEHDDGRVLNPKQTAQLVFNPIQFYLYHITQLSQSPT